MITTYVPHPTTTGGFIYEERVIDFDYIMERKVKDTPGVTQGIMTIGPAVLRRDEGTRPVVSRELANELGLEAVYESGEYGDHAKLRTLISRGANLNVIGGRGETALLNATSASVELLDVVRLLIAEGADVNYGADGSFPLTPLISAAFEGHVNIVRELIAAEADLNKRATNALKVTALGAARSRPRFGESAEKAAGRAEIVRILTEAGAKE